MEENQNVEEVKNEVQENNEMEQKLAALQKEADENNDRLKRIMAEFENFKKSKKIQKNCEKNLENCAALCYSIGINLN